MRLSPLYVPLLLLPLTLPAQGPTLLERELLKTSDLVISATVRIKALGKAKGVGDSSGVVVDPRGLVLSDADATLVEVTGPEKKKVHALEAIVYFPPPLGKSFPARLIKRDEATDTSLLQLELPSHQRRVPALRLARESSFFQGNYLLVSGNAFGQARDGKPAVSLGILAAWAAGKGDKRRFVTNAPVNMGSNGGPVVDLAGNLLGVVSTFDASPTSPFYGFGLITPWSMCAFAYKGLAQAAPLFSKKQKPPRRLPKVAALLSRAYSILMKQAAPSVATLEVDRGDAKNPKKIPIRRPQPGGPKEITIPSYPGPYTALCIDAQGFLITATDSLWQTEKIKSLTVTLGDGRRLPAQLVAQDLVCKIALLKVDNGKKPLPLLPNAPGPPPPGSLVLALGRPGKIESPGQGLLVTAGVVSAGNQGNPAQGAVQVDAGINDAMIGGAVIDLKGRLVGMSLLFSPDHYGRNSGIGFALPPVSFSKPLFLLRQGKSREPGWFGITMKDNLSGQVEITTVAKKSPAAKGGLQKGDILLQVDQKKVAQFGRFGLLSLYLRKYGAGDKVTLLMQRGKKKLHLTVTLGKRP